jgi:sulfide:quinone oxidoreductase
MSTSTLILGAGFGGLAAARTLRHLLPRQHRITVVDQSTQFYVGATKTWVMLGDRTVDSIQRDRASLLPGGVEFHQAGVLGIDIASGRVTTTMGELKADYLVIALGADVTMDPVPGLKEAADSFYTVDGAVKLREKLNGFGGGEVVFLIPRTPFKCPPAPYEAAMLLDHAFRKKELREKSPVSIYTIEPSPMPTAGPEMGSFIRGLLAEREIPYHPLKKTTSVSAAERRVFFEDGSSVQYDLLIAIPPHVPPPAVRESGLTSESGWIPVDPKMMRVKHEGLAVPTYAVGDITSVALPGRYKPDVPLVLPKAGVFAAAHGEIAAGHIAASILGSPASESFDGRGFCYIEVGEDKAVKGEGSFFELPHPIMTSRPPDKEQYRDKLDWVERWLSVGSG